MTYHDKVYELLKHWEELSEHGNKLSVEQLCAECPELRTPVERALRQLKQVGVFIDRLTGEGATLPLPAALGGDNGRPAAAGARFQFLRPHRKGGLGEVFVAYDQEFRREVALKCIQTKHASDADSCRRFQREAEITGQLEHPGIVPVYALTPMGAGPPGYSMRLIQGETLKEAIQRFHRGHESEKGTGTVSGPAAAIEDQAKERPEKEPVPFSDSGERSLAFRQLLNRFLTVCQTIAYAHSRGIIHRDLKPDNVILGKYGETIVVDWGLAKPVRGEAREMKDEESGRAVEGTPLPSVLVGDSVATERGQVVGTPRFMSPEQAAGRSDQVGPASDIYSLGVTLYCLLTGAIPFLDPHEAGVPAVLLRIQQGEFRRPRQVQRKMAPALEAICLKAMALRPEERYASAGALADDLEHWLADEPVAAYREPWLGRLRRWGRGHRPLVTGLAATLVVGLLGLTAGLVAVTGLNRQLDVANAGLVQKSEDLDARNTELIRANANLVLANKNEQQSREQAQNVLTYFVDAFRRADPRQDGDKVTIVEVLKRSAEELPGRTGLDPATRAALLRAIGLTYLRLGLRQEAVEILQQARALHQEHSGPDNPDTLTSMSDLASAYREVGRLTTALPLFEVTLKLQKAKLGSEHPSTLTTMNNLAMAYREAGRLNDALPLIKETLRLTNAKLGPEHIDTLSAMSNFAETLMSLGRWTDALPLLEQTVQLQKAKLGPDHPNTLTCISNLAMAYGSSGRWAEAQPLLEETVHRQKAKLGPDHVDTLTSMNNLAVAYRDTGRMADALALLEEILRLLKVKLGPDHRITLTSMNNLGNAYREAGRVAEALLLLQETVKLTSVKLGPEHQSTFSSINSLAAAYHAAGRLADALPLLEESVRLSKAKLGVDHPDTLLYMKNLASLYGAAGRWADALPLIEETLKLRTAKLGAEHPDTLSSMNDLAVAYRAGGRVADALSLLEKTLKLQKAKLGPVHPKTLATVYNLARVLEGQGKLVEAEALFREILSQRNALAGDHHLFVACLAGLGALLVEIGKAQEAEPFLRDCLELRRKSLPKGHRLISESEIWLGRCLMVLGHYADAEPFLLSGYAGSRKGAKYVIELYEAWGKPEAAAAWRAEQDQQTQPNEKIEK